MRLHLTVQRHGLPVTRILWTTSPPSLFGHSLSSPSSMIPATASAITSSRVPNALCANGGYTVAQLLEDVNEVIPLETEPRSFENESSGQWGLEDYVVEVGGSECLHFMEVEGILRDGDEVLIRALQISDLRARRLSGRHQISVDGKHLIDGVPFGKPFLKRPTSSRPAILIPPRKKRRVALAYWGSGTDYEEEDTECAPHTHINTGKELSVLQPASDVNEQRNDEYKSIYQDDYEDYYDPNEEGDGTVIRHNVDGMDQESESDEDVSDFEDEDLTQELQDLKKDMKLPPPPLLEKGIIEVKGAQAHDHPVRPSDHQIAPRKSSFARPTEVQPDHVYSSRRDSKAVKFDAQGQESPVAKPETSSVRACSISFSPPDSVSSETTSSTSASDTSESEPELSESESDSDSDSDAENLSSDESSSSSSDATSESTSDSEEDSTSESSASDSENELEEFHAVEHVPRLSTNVNPPGEGSLRTRKSNQRNKLRRKLTKLKELGILDKDADFAALRKWEEENGSSFAISERNVEVKQREKDEFEAKRQKLLRDLESGGIDVSVIFEKENITPDFDAKDSQGEPGEHDEVYETANDTNETSPEVSQRRTLDVASTRRLLFGSLGVRTPRSKEEEEATRKKLAERNQQFVPQQTTQEDATAASAESEPDVEWREKLTLGATECFFDDIELSTPPFPFEQRWDAEAGDIMRQRQGKGKKRRRRREQIQVYDEGDYGDDSYFEDGMQLDYDDAEQYESAVNDRGNEGTAEDTEDDLPHLPVDTGALPDLTEDDTKPGMVFAFKQLDVSKATNWQPLVSEYRVAVVKEVFEDNIISIQLAKPYRRQPKEDNEGGPFQYSGFEMPGMDDDEDDDGFREVPFDDLLEPKLLRAAAATDIGGEENASNSPAIEKLSGQSQSVVDVAAQMAEDSTSLPTFLDHELLPTQDAPAQANSPVGSPRFDGFGPSSPRSSRK